MADKQKKTKLQLHHLKPAPGSRQTKIRVGRGEGGRRGKTAGRGTKGLNARSKLRPGLLIKYRHNPSGIAAPSPSREMGFFERINVPRRAFP